MDDDQSSFFGRFYTCVNSSFSKEVSNPCKPGQKSFVAGLFDSKPKEPPERAKASEGKRAKPDESKAVKNDEPSEDKEPEPQQSYQDGATDSPPAENICFIKEQNPLDPCCCELKTDDEDDGSPCPPAGYSENPRVPGCGCDLCRKSGYHGSCCGRRAYVQGGDEEPPRFEQA
ncbi:uncharacterized protein LOC103315331 isoform X1 [Nasonia vitripennis]|uniref:Uncharacterized protein n=2 Tax=Nasonia vitripennis TaxID=7425 RepID=A0A7M7H802_NASVI|nr:uncharacterized protein LOC103315331 isoform X1 [Nasonia vitripennis]